MLSFTDLLPSISEVPEARAAAVRARLAALLLEGWPDLDTAPNTPFGDLHLTPLAFLHAALEIATERKFSDLDLGNVAEGVIYDCDFVREYMKNYAPTPRDGIKASGIVRLTFSTDAARVVDRGTLFAFGTGNVFGIRLPGPGHLIILPVGAPKTELNQVPLSQLDRSSFVVDIPVAGIMTTAVEAGTDGASDVAISGLIGITSLNAFSDGTYETSLKELAKKTRETFYSASLTSRGGVSAFLAKEFPEIKSTSSALSGDLEMLRDSINPIGLVNGSIDVYTKSKQAFQADAQLVKLIYDEDLDKFIGKLELANQPVKLDSVVCDSAPEVGLVYAVFSASKNPARAPMATAAYSELEQLYIEVTMPRDAGDRLITVENGFGYFLVSYRYDPGLKQVVTTLNSPDVRPVGIDVLARGFVPIVVDNLLIEYVKKPGKQVNLDQARQEILTYVNGLGYPDVFLDSALGDSMLYAGASGIKRINVSASVRWSVAGKFLPDTADPSEDWTVTLSALTPPTLDITTTADLTPTFRDPGLGSILETRVAAGKRNVTYILDTENLHFSEYSS